MNNGQRCQLNFHEQLPIVIISALLAGLRFTHLTFYLLIAYCVGRMAYNIGYMQSPNKRVVGAIIQDIAVLSLIVMSFMALYKLIKFE